MSELDKFMEYLSHTSWCQIALAYTDFTALQTVMKWKEAGD